MPSFSEAVGVIATLIVLAVASGREDLVWRAIVEARKVALANARTDWGCPSVFSKSACGSYDPARYR